MTKTLKFISLVLFIAITPANTIPDKYQKIANDIIEASLSDSLTYNRLAYLCDTFGPRLSGSTNLENAIDWILEAMKKDGLTNVRGEKVNVPVWIRGRESARLIEPFAKDLAKSYSRLFDGNSFLNEKASKSVFTKNANGRLDRCRRILPWILRWSFDRYRRTV